MLTYINKFGRTMIATDVVIATISMFHKIHEWNRKNLPGYFEVFLDVPINELQKRDTKKLYKNISNGVISEVVGLDIPFGTTLATSVGTVIGVRFQLPEVN